MGVLLSAMGGIFRESLLKNSGIFIAEKNALFTSQILIPLSFQQIKKLQQKKLRKLQEKESWGFSQNYWLVTLCT